METIFQISKQYRQRIEIHRGRTRVLNRGSRCSARRYPNKYLASDYALYGSLAAYIGPRFSINYSESLLEIPFQSSDVSETVLIRSFY